MDIRLIWNVAYRPDFNGIETVWAWCKKQYRDRIDFYKANNIPWE